MIIGNRGPLRGDEPPKIVTAVPGPESCAWYQRGRRVAAPMGPRSAPQANASNAGTIVYREGLGSNVVDVDGNRYVDLAAGFGSLLLGHRPPRVLSALEAQAQKLTQALGDLHPSDIKIQLLERLAKLAMADDAQVILAQSGADAVSAALKTAMLYTGKPGVIAFSGAYHGLSYGPLALCGLRESYRAPFSAQLSPHVRFAPYPTEARELDAVIALLRAELGRGDVGAIVFEPILGRGGCVVPPVAFGHGLRSLSLEFGCLLVADEIWTGLGRSGQWLYTSSQGIQPDLVCLGKGLGGILPVSACIGRGEVMASWSQADEVVHTATFAGSPLACATALATLDQLEGDELVARSRRVGSELGQALRNMLKARAVAASIASDGVRGAGLMLGIDLGTSSGLALSMYQRLLARGYIVSLGGGSRESIVLSPALDIDENLLQGFISTLADLLAEPAR